MISETKLKDFLTRRKKKTLTVDDIKALVDFLNKTLEDKEKYHADEIETLVRNSGWSEKDCAYTWDASGLTAVEARKKIHKQYRKKIPYHFAYIKFYTIESAEGTQDPFALVAGKTNLGPKGENPDFEFSLKIESKKGDRAKRFLLDHDGHRWSCPMVLAIWRDGQKREGEKDTNDCPVEEQDRLNGPEAILAERVESDIGGLLGLFSS